MLSSGRTRPAQPENFKFGGGATSSFVDPAAPWLMPEALAP
jgi:hypothetical protein